MGSATLPLFALLLCFAAEAVRQVQPVLYVTPFLTCCIRVRQRHRAPRATWGGLALVQEDGTGGVAEARDAALAALDKPLGKMRVKVNPQAERV